MTAKEVRKHQRELTRLFREAEREAKRELNMVLRGEFALSADSMSLSVHERLNHIEKMLEGLTLAIAAEKPMNTKEAAAFLGVSVNTLLHLTSSGAIPYFKAGGKLNSYLRSDLLAYRLKHRIPSREEHEQAARARA